jgi:hypothetical protein
VGLPELSQYRFDASVSGLFFETAVRCVLANAAAKAVVPGCVVRFFSRRLSTLRCDCAESPVSRLKETMTDPSDPTPCNCPCHYAPGVSHIIPCCDADSFEPAPPEPEKKTLKQELPVEWFRYSGAGVSWRVTRDDLLALIPRLDSEQRREIARASVSYGPNEKSDYEVGFEEGMKARETGRLTKMRQFDAPAPEDMQHRIATPMVPATELEEARAYLTDGKWAPLTAETLIQLTDASWEAGKFSMRLLAAECWRLHRELAELKKRETQCVTCGGRGKVPAGCFNAWLKCPDCSGGEPPKCPRCNGEGGFSVDYPPGGWQLCQDCRGTKSAK